MQATRGGCRAQVDHWYAGSGIGVVAFILVVIAAVVTTIVVWRGLRARGGLCTIVGSLLSEVRGTCTCGESGSDGSSSGRCIAAFVVAVATTAATATTTRNLGVNV